ncbi:MAG: PepSY-associated TM helix domain-containing protein [Sphingobium sp.]
MASLHSWAGLLPGWVLFLVFLFGTVAFFQEEVSRWMRPEQPAGLVTARALDAADDLLRTRAAGARSWRLSLPAPRSGDGFKISWTPEGKGAGKGKARSDRRQVTLDPNTGREITVRETQGGRFLYRFHYELHYLPSMWARYIVGGAAMAMLVAILSGIVTHKKIFTDFFMLRFGKGQRSWLDAHNVTAVLALPFFLMMTYTGLVALLFTLMPWAINASFSSQDAFHKQSSPRTPKVEASGDQKPLLPISQLVARASAGLVGIVPGSITIGNPGDAASVVEIGAAGSRLGNRVPPVRLNGSSGEVLTASPPPRGGARASQRIMVDLHRGRFAGPALRWLYFLSGVGGAVMVASGLVLWTVKRRAKLPDPARPHFGFRLVERLNIGVIAGAPAGIAVYFLANRLLPVEFAHRAEWEINSLFIAWGALFVWTLTRSAKRAWIEGLAICAAFYALVPVVNALTTSRGMVPSLIARDWIFVGFDGVMLATAATAALAAWKVAAHEPKVAPRRKARELAEVAA